MTTSRDDALTDLDARVTAITRWALAPETQRLPLGDFLAGLAKRLNEAGVPVDRVRTSATTKHPELFVRAFLWHVERGIEIRDGKRDLLTTATYLGSPVLKVRLGTPSIRCRLTGPDADLSYAICHELAAEGLTDYLVLGLPFSDGERSYVSFATSRPEGFSPSAIAALEALLPVVAVRVEIASKEFALVSLLEVYLGKNAASRVLAGSFLRGTGEDIHAAIWFCDMRGFTAMASQRSAADVVRVLDRFFEAVAGPIGPLGGEVLKFIGDAVLAIFPVREDGPEAACQRALSAATAALERVSLLNARNVEEGLGTVDLGIGLHLGEVMYGNIGARDRLDFTVIGSVVNEVCRVESLCRSLGSPVLMTAAFASACPGAGVESRGAHVLKGVAVPMEIFSLKGISSPASIGPGSR